MGNPFYRDGTSGNAAGALALTIPATTQPGDKIVISSCYKATVASGTNGTPAGFALLQGPTDFSGATGNGMIFTKDAVAADAGATVTLTPTGAQQNEAALVVVGNAGAVRASGWTDQGVTAGTALSVGSQTAQASDLILLCGAARGAVNGPAGTPSFSAPTDYVMRQQSTGASGSAQNVGAFIATGNVPGTQTVTANANSWAITGQVVIQATTATLGALGCG